MNPRRMIAVVLVVFGSTGACVSDAQAGLVAVLSRSDLNANDLIDWGALGQNQAVLPNSFVTASTGGMGVSVSQAFNFQLLVQGAPGGWAGSFSPGETVLWTNTISSTTPRAISMNFDSPVLGVGMNIQQANPVNVNFTARMDVFGPGDAYLGWVSVTGPTTTLGDGSAPFLGVRSTDVAISRVILYLTAAPFNATGSYGINQVSLVRAPSTNTVPEPSTLLSTGLAGAVLLGVGFARSRRK